MKNFRSNQALRRCIAGLLNGPRHPEQPFVVGQTSFAELYAMAGSLQRFFRHDDQTASVCLGSSDKTIIAASLLASMAGGPTLILPHAATPKVLAETYRLTGYRHVITEEPFTVPDGVVCVVPEKDITLRPFFEDPMPKALDGEWVRLFTGGTTGAPRIWTKTVRNLMAETISIVEHYDVTNADRLVATVIPNHIYGLLYAVLTPLLASASVASSTPSFPEEIKSVTRETGASILISVPAHYRALHGHALEAPQLRIAMSSAGMLSPKDAEAFTRQTGVGVVEIYGSTETGGIASRTRAKGEVDFEPYTGISIRVDNGFLSVSSDYLSPELPQDPEGFFQVGDRAALTQGGRFQLLGRADGVIKVGGRRVDMEAVNAQVKSHPNVRDALVIALPVGRSRENLMVAVVEGNVETSQLNQFLSEILAPYARPKRIKIVNRIPMTAAGKYDRRSIEKLFL